ncbi:helix-turn-helix domain-containing protein [Amycolatopsis rhabdoformis]|uniref:Helix-turn-helix domain-containing protein n=1 Tax=Amycolatopsis rhabdoformis TaxID=1448059 RepID=A0ABZ1IFK6_9PSEU|nr:helix-turn-helix domain-containing protein [Amycolatopsis rhabdoformis]WSE32531.1 helix-turn-helix domain-containing protein [Amycolatopsis rhabdoformis]
MALPKYYAGQQCSLARSLEIVGERWTLLILRDAFFGVRRFGDFQAHLGMSRAVLTERLEGLLEAGLLTETPGSHGYREYVLTDKGLGLWPAVRDLLAWGDEHFSPRGPRRVFRHVRDSGLLAQDGSCSSCGRTVDPAELDILPGPGYDDHAGDFVSEALAEPHRMLEPLRAR